jgi:hypothetical protein
LLFFPREVDGFAREALRDFAPLIFAGKEVAWFKATLTHLLTAPCSALLCPLTAKIPGIRSRWHEIPGTNVRAVKLLGGGPRVEPDYQVVTIHSATHAIEAERNGLSLSALAPQKLAKSEDYDG